MKKVLRSSRLELLNQKETSWLHGKTKVILFSGKAGVGKTTCANIFKKLIEDQFLLVDIDSFARGVKEAATRAGWDGEKDEKGRKLLQDVGREGRERDPNTWVDQVISRSTHPILKDAVIIDDWRYPNELKRLRNNKLFDVISIRINAPDREILSGTAEANDSSETALPCDNDTDTYDFYIDNNGNMDDLEAELIDTMETVLK